MHLYPKMSTSTLPDNGRTVDTTWVELPGSSFRLTALKSSIRPNVPPPHLYVVPGLVPPPHCRYSKYVLRIRVFPPNSTPGDVPIGLLFCDVPCQFPSPLVGGRGRTRQRGGGGENQQPSRFAKAHLWSGGSER